MPIRAKYVHTNLIARDWKRLVRFYCEVFGCEPAGPERDMSGGWLDSLTSLPNAQVFICVCLALAMMVPRLRFLATIS